MRMGLRDRKFWLREAILKSLVRRLDAYRAAILPYRQDVDKEIKRLNWQVYEMEHEEEIDFLEKSVKEKMKQLEEMRKDRKKEEVSNG